jgi:hypothetical protein
VRRLLPLLIALASPILAGCATDPTRGYAFTSAHPAHVHSIAVQIFQNETFTRGIEIDLSDALVKEIQRATPYRVVTTGDAQTVLTGTITRSRLQQLTVARTTGMGEEIAVDLYVDFEWRDARTGEPLIRRENLRAVEVFVPARPTNERLELGQHAAVQEMARAIIAEMRASW